MVGAIKHNERLQSLRGLAALCVLGGHSALVLSTGIAQRLQWMFQPNAAVVLFYVMSGYVLALSLERDHDAVGFLVRRAFRILPVYWLGVFVGCGSYLLADHPAIDGSTPWFNGTIAGSAGAVQWQNIWPNLIAWTTSMSGVLWSVQVELFAAPFILLMFFVSRRVPLAVDAAIIAALAVMMDKLRASPIVEQIPQLMFFAYAACFYVGVALLKLLNFPLIRSLLRSGILAAGALAFSAFLYGHAPLFRTDFYGYLVACVFVSAWLVGYGAVGSVRGPLSWRPLVDLGNISYSFYAYATPILMPVALAIFLLAPVSWRTSGLGSLAIISAALVGSLVITVPLAALSYRYVEKPGIRAGVLVTSWLQRCIRASRSIVPARAQAE